jgi:phage gpG-like protein
MNIALKEFDNKAILKGLNKYKKRVDDVIKDGIIDWAEFTEQEAKRDAPVRTGELQRSIYKEVKDYEASVGVPNDIDYAPYVEFGTGTKVDVPTGLEEYALQFKSPNEHNVNLPARPYLFSNARVNFAKFMERMKRLQ